MKKLALGVCVLSLMFVAACGKKAPESTDNAATSTANAAATANAPAAAATANY